ncbi:DUF72 domain-containing protein [Oleiagrimonas sp. C23AA]|uniref:DUF72 domain-containing protein n=1 Tax=Oleiagrimonas sp. C23AA TaxID=2719047 RepID=UPI001423EA71|nr:DUF72 domain-containing protein [Oleiagrimonas sp. C23AA]NII12232.1 DUF72 domain-containing protein [Oleiagrimonas sp. C23AA]
MARIRIGISGWRYQPWRGVFYPDDLPQRRELAYASRQFACIELNGSFYSLQTPDRYRDWYRSTPSGFVFAVKGPRYITHIRRLREVRTALANFFASGVLALEEKLGPMLWQLPPSLRYDEDLLEAFLKLLPKDTDAAGALAAGHDDHLKTRGLLHSRQRHRLRHALEVRHDSFCDARLIRQLRRHGVALVVADSDGRWPVMHDVTAGFMYLRLHGQGELYAGGYDDQALDAWAKRLRAWHRAGQPQDAQLISDAAPPARQARDIYLFFDNDQKVRAPHDARALMQRLHLAWGEARET